MKARKVRMPPPRVDVAALEAKVDLVALVGARVDLKRQGSEWAGLCPFHEEDTPSFTVNPVKGFVHCFGCGFHRGAVGFLMSYDNIDFLEACKRLGENTPDTATAPRAARARRTPAAGAWSTIMPVPVNAAPLRMRGGVRAWNPKSNRWSRLLPTRTDAYRDANGQLLGYVMRLDLGDRKIAVTATWCQREGQTARWCLQAFPEPRPLQGLDALAVQVATIAGPSGRRRALIAVGTSPELASDEWLEKLEWLPVLVVEGEKCREAAAQALPHYAVVTWPGGTGGIGHVDWSPLQGRDVVLWEDADAVGRAAMRGRVDDAGDLHPGIAQLAYAAGARSVRAIDTKGMPDGWDVADALDPKGNSWSPRQLMAWAVARVAPIENAIVTIEPSEPENIHE